MQHDSYLPESPETYWRWGIPSLVLAVVTIACMGLSQWIVEPRVAGQYTRIVTEALDRQQTTIDSLRRADLASQRLMVLAPEDARQRRLHAELCFKIALESDRLQSEPSMSLGYRNRGIESLRSATRMGGPDALWARRWLLGEELLRSRQAASLDEQSASRLLDNLEEISIEDHSGVLELYAGALNIQQGHRMGPDFDADSRDGKLRDGVRQLESFLNKQSRDAATNLDFLIAKAWLAEGLASLDPEQATALARDAVVTEAAQLQSLEAEPSPSRRIEAIDALSRCLLLVSGSEESANSVLSRFDQVAEQDRNLLRHVVVSSYLRGLVSRANVPESAFGECSVGGVLTAALRVGPEHPELAALIDAILQDPPESLGSLSGLLTLGDPNNQDRFLAKLEWIRRTLGGIKGSVNDGSELSPKWEDRERDLAIGLMAYWIGAVRRRPVEWDRIEPILAKMLEAYPTSGDLRLGRAIVASTLGRWEIAKEDLEVVSKSNPGNEFIEKLLIKARENDKSTAGGESR